ncbi:hypothetical protein F4802DRAFT_557193 [Xylaria palmicola]|nr:hypothetical protein F4802DRAFT_557193 [Xylaria palmicola]
MHCSISAQTGPCPAPLPQNSNIAAILSLNPHVVHNARLAQSVERETLNLKVAGSTPALGSIPDASQFNWELQPQVFFFSLLFPISFLLSFLSLFSPLLSSSFSFFVISPALPFLGLSPNHPLARVSP